MQIIQDYLEQAGFSDKESLVYLTLYQHELQAASSVARLSGLERVTTYKILLQFVENGLVSETTKQGTKHFWIPNIDLLQSYIQKRQEKRSHLDQQFSYIKTEFDSINKIGSSQTPQLRLFEGETQLEQLFQDIKNTISEEKLLVIQFFGTHTFQDQITSSKTLASTTQSFFEFLGSENITLHSSVAEGGLIMESLSHYTSTEELGDLPAGNDAINIFVVGKILYIVIYKNSPIGIKLASQELAWAIGFLLRVGQKN